MRNVLLALMAIALGLVLGFAPFYLQMGWFSLIPWVLAGIALGYVSRRDTAAAIRGALYGFVLTMTFLIAGYAGSAPVYRRLLFFAICSVFGAICGRLATAAGIALRRDGVIHESAILFCFYLCSGEQIG